MTNLKSILQRKIMLIWGIVFVAFSLRAPLSYSPLVNSIRSELGLTNTEVGLLMTLPLLLFAIFSPIATRLGNRLGNELAIFIGLLVLTLGEFIRPYGGAATLFSEQPL